MEPHAPPGDDPRLQPLVGYLEQHQGQFDRAALRQQLIDAGHPPELVDTAVARVGGAPQRKPLAWPYGLLVMLANLIVIPPLFGGAAGLIGALFPASTNDLLWLIAPLLIGGAPLVAELAVGLRLRGGPRDRLGRTLIWGVAFTMITVALLALLVGICIAVLFGGFS